MKARRIIELNAKQAAFRRKKIMDAVRHQLTGYYSLVSESAVEAIAKAVIRADSTANRQIRQGRV